MLILHAPAKINWFLKVLEKREDGYHNIYSVMQPLRLHDVLTFERQARGITIRTDLELEVEDNLIYKAAIALKDKTSYRGGAIITLTKRIPLQAGLGGGSSDAATTLAGLNRLWELRLDKEELSSISSLIGSDMPFFIHRRLSVAEGRGEIITPLDTMTRPVSILIVKPAFGVSTPVAYRNVRVFSERDLSLENSLINALKKGDLRPLKNSLVNDLEGPVFHLYPELARLKREILDSGAISALLCGSGSALFGVFSCKEDAGRAASRFGGYWNAVTETL